MSQSTPQPAAGSPGALLGFLPAEGGYATRAGALCQLLEGAPYLTAPLGGGAGLPEVLNAGLEGFDCVTFVETVVALALSEDETSFRERLRLLRYSRGEISWETRRHYFSLWLKENRQEGRLLDPAHLPPPRRIARTLTVLPDLGAVPALLEGWPRNRLKGFRPYLRSGDVVGFLSTRRHLDYFHVGLLLEGDAGVLLVHASRSRGRVVLEPLETFLSTQRTSGISLARPCAFPVSLSTPVRTQSEC